MTATYGDRLRLLLAHVPDLSIRELDRVSGLGEGHSSQILGGTKGAGWKTASKHAGALGCAPTWLLDGTGSAPRAGTVRRAVAAARSAHAARSSAPDR